MRRKRLLLAAVASLAALSGLVAGGAFLANPATRARYHLRRATPGELLLGPRGELTIDHGHARAFSESSAAKELLPELAALAEAETVSDDGACFRPLYVGMRSQPRIPEPQTRQRTVFYLVPPPVPVPVLSVMLRNLASSDRALRCWILMRLPAEPSLVEVVVKRLAWVARHRAESSVEERDAVVQWLRDTARTRRKLFTTENGHREGPGPLDDPWGELVVSRDVPFTHGQGVRPGDSECARLLLAWLERHRAELPEQLHP